MSKQLLGNPLYISYAVYFPAKAMSDLSTFRCKKKLRKVKLFLHGRKHPEKDGFFLISSLPHDHGSCL